MLGKQRKCSDMKVEACLHKLTQLSSRSLLTVSSHIQMPRDMR